MVEKSLGIEVVGLEMCEEGLLEGKGVAFLVLGVLAQLLLHGVVGEVDVGVHAVERVGVGGGADVGLVVKVDLEVGAHQHPHPHIKFASLVEEGSLDRLLRYPESRAAYHPELTGFEMRKLSISLMLLERIIPLPWLSDSGFTNHTFFWQCF